MPTEEPSGWTRQVLERRAVKDRFFRLGADSPLPPESRSSFRGLEYYPLDSQFRVPVSFVPHSGQETLLLEVSRGPPRTLMKRGHFDFQIGGRTLRLAGYAEAHGALGEALFVPFRDATSGRETYGAGRYLDIGLEGRQEATIDFNGAYNPFCAYSEHYSCPLPPPENWLPVPVRAGEKDFPHPPHP